MRSATIIPFKTRATDGRTQPSHLLETIRPETSPISCPHADYHLPLHAGWLGRPGVPPSADLLGLCRGSNQPVRPMGGRLDDPCTTVPLSSLRDFRARFPPACIAAELPVVSALAVRPLA